MGSYNRQQNRITITKKEFLYKEEDKINIVDVKQQLDDLRSTGVEFESEIRCWYCDSVVPLRMQTIEWHRKGERWDILDIPTYHCEPCVQDFHPSPVLDLIGDVFREFEQEDQEGPKLTASIAATEFSNRMCEVLRKR